MKYTLIIATILSFAPSITYGLTGPYAPGGQYNPINVYIQDNGAQQAEQQFLQLENQLNLQAANEPAACASILAQARSFIRSTAQHSASPDQEGADAYQLNAYYNQNTLCIAQHPVLPATTGSVGNANDVLMQKIKSATCMLHPQDPSCAAPAPTQPSVQTTNASVAGSVSYDQQCVNAYGAHSVWTDSRNSTGGPVCSCATGYHWNSAETECVAMPAPARAKQTQPASKFYVDVSPDAQNIADGLIARSTTTSASEPGPVEKRGFWSWFLGLFR